ncbi:MAG TPA: STAS domain-containing protein [Actinomycetota bacterium]|nr:STAS domain-containing protein [Actinomycetota bacterium]
MSLSIEQTGPRAFRAAGEIDLSNVDLLREPLEGAIDGPGDLTVDLSGVTFMDSQGIRVVIAIAHQLEGHGRLILLKPSRPVARVFDLMGIAKLGNLVVADDVHPDG